MSLNLTFPYKDKSAIDDMLRMDEIKDLAERDFKHWGNTPFFIARTYSNRVYPRKKQRKVSAHLRCFHHRHVEKKTFD